jgi:hypothetical protein
LNIEATLSYQKQHQVQLRIFISEHKWKLGQPTAEEAPMILSYGDGSGVPVLAIFMFVRAEKTQKRLEELSEATIREAEAWDWSCPNYLHFSFIMSSGARARLFTLQHHNFKYR